jgi:trigger factor
MGAQKGRGNKGRGPAGPSGRAPESSERIRADARQTSLEAGRALQRMLDAAPGAKVNHGIAASTTDEALRVLSLAETLEVHVPAGMVTDEHVAQRIDDLRRQLSLLSPLGREEKLELGDEVFVDLLGYLGGEPFVAHTNRWYAMAPNPLLPGLFEGLIDQKVPCQRVQQVHLPPTYPVAAHADRTAVFAVHVKEARRRSMPDLDDPVVLPLLNRGVKTPTQLRAKLHQELMMERALQMVDHAKLLVMRDLYRRCAHEPVPDALVDDELTRRWREFVGQSLILQGVSLEEQKRSRTAYGTDANLRAEARRTVWEMRVCEAVAAHLSVEPTEAELHQALRSIFGAGVDIDGALREQPHLRKELLRGLRARRALDHIMQRAKVFFDAMPATEGGPYRPLVEAEQRPKPGAFTAVRGLRRPS